LISSELPELIALSSRILVMKGGRIVGEQARSSASQESLMRMMT
jgi:ABC-type sugar transport system ATPase subunit